VGDDGRFDTVFLGIAQQAQGIDAILGSFFGFLRRKTDFFSQQDRALEVLTRHVSIQSELFSREMAAVKPAAPPVPAPAPAPKPVATPAPAPKPVVESKPKPVTPSPAPPPAVPADGEAATELPDE